MTRSQTDTSRKKGTMRSGDLLHIVATSCWLVALLCSVDAQIVADETCRPGWRFYNNSHSVGAKRLTQFTSLDACMTACADLITNCVAVDVNFALAGGSVQCWVHTRVDPLAVKYWSDTVLQAVLTTRCPVAAGCNRTAWRLYADRNSFWGSQQAPRPLTLSDCLQRCTDSGHCLAVDFDNTATAANCFHHSADQFVSTRGAYPGTDQYAIDQCRVDTVARTSCTYGWKLTLDAADFGAVRYASVKTQEDCRETCQRNSSCTAYDYWPHGPQFCWISTPTATEPLTADTGNYHFDLVKRCSPL